jgi:hypothetical protein
MLLAGGMNKKQWRDTGLSKLLPVICIGVVMLPACVLAMGIISQVSVAVRYQLRTWRSQLVLQRLDVS